MTTTTRKKASLKEIISGISSDEEAELSEESPVCGFHTPDSPSPAGSRRGSVVQYNNQTFRVHPTQTKSQIGYKRIKKSKKGGRRRLFHPTLSVGSRRLLKLKMKKRKPIYTSEKINEFYSQRNLKIENIKGRLKEKEVSYEYRPKTNTRKNKRILGNRYLPIHVRNSQRLTRDQRLRIQKVREQLKKLEEERNEAFQLDKKTRRGKSRKSGYEKQNIAFDPKKEKEIETREKEQKIMKHVNSLQLWDVQRKERRRMRKKKLLERKYPRRPKVNNYTNKLFKRMRRKQPGLIGCVYERNFQAQKKKISSRRRSSSTSTMKKEKKSFPTHFRRRRNSCRPLQRKKRSSLSTPKYDPNGRRRSSSSRFRSRAVGRGNRMYVTRRNSVPPKLKRGGGRK